MAAGAGVNAQVAVEVYTGAVVIRSGGRVVGRFNRDETGTATVNLADHPDAEGPDAEPWTRFEPAAAYREGRRVELPAGVEMWQNNLYTVHIYRFADGAAYLSIRSNDRHWRHDWRHLQRIKNELLGPDVEAVELYPAVDRLVDDANQFHLWALPAGERFPFGFTGPDPSPVPSSGWRQRPPTAADTPPEPRTTPAANARHRDAAAT